VPASASGFNALKSGYSAGAGVSFGAGAFAGAGAGVFAAPGWWCYWSGATVVLLVSLLELLLLLVSEVPASSAGRERI
jgi:hypothetical protein